MDELDSGLDSTESSEAPMDTVDETLDSDGDGLFDAWERAAQVLREVAESTQRASAKAGRGGQPDGPTAALLNFMKEHQNRAPKGWKGYRELTEK